MADICEQLVLLTHLKEHWRRIRAGTILEWQRDKRRCALMYFDIGRYRVTMVFSVGSRKGVNVELYVVDDRETTAVDCLIVEAYGSSWSPILLRASAFTEMTRRLRAGESFSDVIREAFKRVRAFLEGMPTADAEAVLRCIDSTAGSIRAVSGGLPSLGRGV